MNYFFMGWDWFVWIRKLGLNNNKMVLILKDCCCVNKYIKKNISEFIIFVVIY